MSRGKSEGKREIYYWGIQKKEQLDEGERKACQQEWSERRGKCEERFKGHNDSSGDS